MYRKNPAFSLVRKGFLRLSGSTHSILMTFLLSLFTRKSQGVAFLGRVRLPWNASVLIRANFLALSILCIGFSSSAFADPDAVVELPLDEGSGLVAGDVSGRDNDGLLNGAVFEANTADGSPFAVRFDGVDDYIDLGKLDVSGSGLSLTTWFKADSFPGSWRDARLISKASGTAANDHVFMLSTIRVDAATRLRARVRVGGVTRTLVASSGNVMTGVWYHAALTYDEAMLRLYLDGIEVGSTSLTGMVDIKPSVSVAVGSQPPGSGGKFFDGVLDDVRILQRALSASEVANIAVLGGSQPASGVEYTLEVNSSGSGEVTLDPPGGIYTEGTAVTLTAVAGAGWEFTDWSGDLSGTQNPANLVINANSVVSATFDIDTTAPIISDIQVIPGDTSATVSWSTDELTTGVVDYGETSSYEFGFVEDTALLQNHTITLTGLNPDTTHHLQITAMDNANNSAVSSDVSFITTSDSGTANTSGASDSGTSDIQSDDFHANTLDTTIWTFVDPLNDGSVTVNGTQALISVPAGTSHDVWSTGNNAPRLMQSAQDTDFELEVKFESLLSERYQMHGLLAEQDADNFVRVDFYSDGNNIRAFAAVFENGSSLVQNNVVLNVNPTTLYMRLKREGNVWTQLYSEDGVNWQTAGNFTHALVVNAVGVFAGNFTPNPAYTAVVDYFFNTASPIDPEDGETQHTLTVNVTGSGSVTKNPDKANYQSGDTVELTAIPSTGWTFDSWSGDATGFNNPINVTIDADLVIDASFIQGSVEYSLDVNSAGSGQVTLDPPGGLYNEGTEVTLTAVADANWEFTGWSGDLNGTQNPATLVMTANSAVTANFDSDTTAPVISNIQVVPSGTSARVSWSTDESTTGEVKYGETTSYEFVLVEDTALLQNHSLTLTNLTPGVTYHLQITATDNAGNSADSSDVTFTTTNDNSGIQSDDFNASTLDTTLWNFVNPLNDGSVTVNGTQALISVPAGTSHDVWSTGNDAPRLMQSTSDTDFEIEVKFESVLSDRYQMQGLLAEQDADNFVRVDFYSDGSNTRAFAAVFENGSASVQANVVLDLSGAPTTYMRLKREGDFWTQRYSEDGTNWQTVSTFTHSLAVSAVGVFAGNFTPNPAYTAVVDYFFNTASPIVPEDGETQHTLTVNVTGSGSVTMNPDKASYQPGETVELTAIPSTGWIFDSWSGDVAGLDNPISVTMDADLVIDASFVQGAVEYTLDVNTVGSGQVTLDPPGGLYNEGTEVTLTAVADANWEFSNWSGDLNGTQNPATLVMTANSDVTANFDTGTTATAPVIDLFYGSQQVFGAGGLGQPWVNILGNITDPDGVASASYSLNGDPEVELSLGPDQRRLDEEGDFNADIPADQFIEGDNTVEIRATDLDGNESVRNVTVNFTDSYIPTLPHTVDWGNETSIQDVAQIVDGDWVLEGDTVRNQEMGYDRLIAIGDVSWVDYEATFHVTLNEIEPYYDAPSNGPVLGLIARWPGHVSNGSQPAWRYWPFGMFVFYKWWKNGGVAWYMDDDDSRLDSHQTNSGVIQGTEYIFKIRVKTLGDGSTRYQFKKWPVSAGEPSQWLLEGTVAAGNDVPSGSLLIVSHHVDISVGQVSIVPAP